MLYEGSHGDTQHIVLFPGTVEECFEFGWRAFDYTEKFQTPVFGMSDLDLGMNRWACAGFDYPSENMDRGKVVRDRDVFEAFEEFGRYLDVDGDGIPYRTLPSSEWHKYYTVEQVTTQWVFTPRNLTTICN